MYPVYESLEDNDTYDRPFFLMETDVGTWAAHKRSEPRRGGALRLFSDENEVALSVVPDASGEELKTRLREMAEETGPWVETMTTSYPLFGLEEQLHNLGVLVEQRPGLERAVRDGSQDMETLRRWARESFSYATYAEISTAMAAVGPPPSRKAEYTAEWILGKLKDPDAEARKYLRTTVFLVVDELIELVQGRVFDQWRIRSEKVLNILPPADRLTDLSSQWQPVFPLGFVARRHCQWPEVISQFLMARWKVDPDPATRDMVVRWAFQHLCPVDQIAGVTGLDRKTVEDIIADTGEAKET